MATAKVKGLNIIAGGNNEVGLVDIYDGQATAKKVTLGVNAALAADIAFTLPVALPGSTQAITVTTGGVMGYASVGSGTVTDVSVVTANGVSGSVATSTTTPAITLTLGAITPTTVNGNTITTGTGTLTLGAGSTLATSATNSITLTSTGATNVTLPTTGTLATTAYVDSAISGLSWKTSVRAATTTAGTLATSFEDGDTIDGVTLATGDRILIKNQASGEENGIYVVAASGAPTRSTDADTGAEVLQLAVFVQEGTVNGDTAWVNTTNAPITINTTPLVFAQFSGSGLYTAGNGLTLTGNSFSINTSITADLSTSQTFTNKTLTSPVVNDMRPTTSGGSAIGTSTLAYSKVYLDDTATADIWMLQVTNGVLEVVTAA